jgi:asparagine synthase (glutamine-hydrolysing)
VSAIFGLVLRDGRPVHDGHLDGMRARLEHRGPDAAGTWREGSVGLGQCLLHTTPESLAESGPLVAADRGPVLVADARIDNRDDLIRTLDLHSVEPPITDGDIILAAYRRWGRAAPEKLIGDFAFAVWDADRQALFCARDPMGVRPFYYYASDRLFAFGSELKGVLALPEVPRELDEVQIAYFLDWFRADRERTFFRDVRRLPASHWLEVAGQEMRTGVYWKTDPEREIRFPDEDDYAEAFREHFLEAVRCRLRSGFPIGSALSGGLDSSSIVCTASKLLDGDRPLHTVSAVFPGLPTEYRERNDESRYIEAVTRSKGVVPHHVRADEVGVFDYLDRMFWYHDVPPFGFMYWMRWAVYEAAHREGVRVFFSGDDGDTVVGYGFGLFDDLALEGRWPAAISALEALSRRFDTTPESQWPAYLRTRLVALARTRRWRRWREGCSAVAARFDRSALGLMAGTGYDAFLGEWLVARVRSLRGKNPDPSLVSPGFARRTDLKERKRILSAGKFDPIPMSRASQARVLPSSMLQHIMEVTDAMGSAFSIETRCPFLDRRLVEFSLAIPSDQKLSDGWTRFVLRKAMDGIVPPEVLWRLRKADLAYNMVSHLLDDDRQVMVNALFTEPEVLEGYVDMDELRALQERFDTNRLKGGRQNAARLYIAAVLALWLRRVPSAAPAEPAGVLA